MAKNERSEDFRLNNMRLSYPYLLKPRKIDLDGGGVKFQYQAVLLYPKNVPLVGAYEKGAPAVVADILLEIATRHWGDKALDLIKSDIIKNPLLDGDGKQGLNQKTGVRNPGYEGHKFIRANTSQDRPPACIDNVLGADGKVVLITDPNRLYPGCFVHATVNAFTWENDKGGKGISFGLSVIQFVKDGERLGGTGSGGPDPDRWADKSIPAGTAAPAATADGKGAGGLFA